MAVVKNRLKVFESVADTESMATTRSPTPLKPPVYAHKMTPALQKFMNKQNEALEGKATQGSVAEEAKTPLRKAPDDVVKATRNGLDSGGQDEKDVNGAPAVPTKNIATKPTVGAAKPENRRGSQVIVPNVFKHDSTNTNSVPESRRGSQVNAQEVSKPSWKNTNTFSETNSSDENTKPKPLTKPSSVFPRPPPGPKPQVSANPETSGPAKAASALLPKKPSDIKSEEKVQPSFKDSIKVKIPGMDQLPLKNTASESSGNTPTVSSTTSQPSSTPNEAQGTDFRSILRSVKTQPANESTEQKKPAAIKPVFGPGASSFAKVAETKSAQDKPDLPAQLRAQDKPDLPAQFRGNKWAPSQEMKRQSNSDVIERKSDSKKFKKIKIEENRPFSTPPKKPVLPGNVDLTVVKQQYQRTIQTLKEKSDILSRNGEEDDGELYDDGTSVADVVTRPSKNSRMSERISIIPDMSAEEEGALYDDGCTPISPLAIRRPPVPAPGDDMYVDAETERKVPEEEDLEQLYEDEEKFAVSAEKLEEERKRQQKEEAEAKKKEEKERREKEKEEEKKRKKEEKERAKKEKEEMQLRKKFNLTGNETMVGEGVIQQDVKGGVLGGLSLKKGQTVTIVRLDNNPSNKWLVKSDAGMGYIDSSIIEVDPALIKQAMTSQAKGAHQSKDDDDQPLYDDVPQDGRQNDLEDDFEIYEECP